MPSGQEVDRLEVILDGVLYALEQQGFTFMRDQISHAGKLGTIVFQAAEDDSFAGQIVKNNKHVHEVHPECGVVTFPELT